MLLFHNYFSLRAKFLDGTFMDIIKNQRCTTLPVKKRCNHKLCCCKKAEKNTKSKHRFGERDKNLAELRMLAFPTNGSTHQQGKLYKTVPTYKCITIK